MRSGKSPKVLKVFFFGDSICFGQGVSPHLGWVTRISARLSEFVGGFNASVTVQNPSINGNTSRQALERMAYDVQSHEPDVLLIQFGMNDCNYWATDRGCPRVSPNAFAANLEEMIDRGRRFGARHILLLTNHPSCRDTPFPRMRLTYEESNQQYNTIIRRVAGACKEVVLVDIEERFKAYRLSTKEEIDSYLLPDKLHLGVKGHDIYFGAVWPVIREIVNGELSAEHRESSATKLASSKRGALP